MSSIRKLIERMRNSPKGDWTFEDVRRVLEWYGCDCKPPRGGGSHYKFTHPQVARILVIPKDSPVKACYVLEVLDMIDELEEVDSD